MISDDNVLVHTAADDLMATSLWKAIQEYFKAAGIEIAHDEWDPYLSVKEQNKIDRKMTTHDNTKPGTGINWGEFSKGSHMSTWKYGYQVTILLNGYLNKDVKLLKLVEKWNS